MWASFGGLGKKRFVSDPGSCERLAFSSCVIKFCLGFKPINSTWFTAGCTCRL